MLLLPPVSPSRFHQFPLIFVPNAQNFSLKDIFFDVSVRHRDLCGRQRCLWATQMSLWATEMSLWATEMSLCATEMSLGDRDISVRNRDLCARQRNHWENPEAWRRPCGGDRSVIRIEILRSIKSGVKPPWGVGK